MALPKIPSIVTLAIVKSILLNHRLGAVVVHKKFTPHVNVTQQPLDHRSRGQASGEERRGTDDRVRSGAHSDQGSPQEKDSGAPKVDARVFCADRWFNRFVYPLVPLGGSWLLNSLGNHPDSPESTRRRKISRIESPICQRLLTAMVLAEETSSAP